MHHVSRTHRVNLDWLFERIKLESNISVMYVHTNQQTADISTKGSSTCQKWNELMIMIDVVPESRHRSPIFSRCDFGSACSAEGEEKPSVYRRSLDTNRRVVKVRALRQKRVRHEKSSPLISADEKTQSDVKGQENLGQASDDRSHKVQQSDASSQENPGQASGDRLHFPGVLALGEKSQKVPDGFEPFEQGLSCEPPDTHTISLWNNR